VAHLSYVAQGRAVVEVGGVIVSSCQAGDFIGEMTAMTGAAATATVRADGPCTLWRIEAARLREVLQARSRFGREMDAAFARNYRDKILQMNARSVAGGVTA
jgi:CRP-like cAMP-binding protein